MNEIEPRNRAERRAANRKRRRVASAMTATKVGAVVATTAAAAFVGAGGTSVGATTFTVSNTNDTGAGSLRQAVEDANDTAGVDIINFGPGAVGTITLTTGQLETIIEGVDIQGPGASVLSVEGTGTERIFYIDASGGPTFDVTISGLTLTHADATTVTGNGGAIRNNQGHLTVSDAVVTGNHANTAGGGIQSHGTTNALAIVNSTISGNEADADGGGVDLYGQRGELSIVNSTISGNYSGDEGGGLYFYSQDGIVNITGSTISDNDSAGGGGGANLRGTRATARVTNSTVSGNEAHDNGGGGLYLYTDGVVIEESTISDNTAANSGGGLYFDENVLGIEIHNSVISGNHALDGGGGGASFYYTSGTVNIVDTTISGNDSTDGGGGLYFDSDLVGSPGAVTIRNSTISGNTTEEYGGGLYIDGMLNQFKVLNSTISGNTADLEGGGISFLGYYGLVLIQDTITNNTGDNYGGLYLPAFVAQSEARLAANAAEKGDKKATRNPRAAAKQADKKAGKGPHAQLATRYAYSGETTSIATIIAGNSGTDISPGSTVHSDHSLFGTVGTGVTIDDQGGTLIGANPVLGPLANNGGVTQTHALLTGSAAIDTGLTVEPAFPGNTFDQRGAPYDRIENGVSDIGAYEVQIVTPTPAPTPVPTPTPTPTPAPLDVVVISPRFTG